MSLAETNLEKTIIKERIKMTNTVDNKRLTILNPTENKSFSKYK